MRRIADINSAKEFVRERANLLQIIEEDVGDVEWKEEGSNTYVITSPFRNETKPSFKVSGNRFKDWGGEQHGGDVFYWAQLWHGLRFEESIIHVADRCKIDISKYLRDPTPEELQASHYKQINKIAAEWMHQCLRENSLVRDDYLARSGFTLDMIEPYLVGYCPTVDALISNVASQIQLSEEDVNKLELNRRDLFTNSIVYPVHNHSGDVSFFYSKQLGEDKHYMGMKKEHPLHDLGIIYGFHIAKNELRRNGAKLVLIEGAGHNDILKAIKNYKVKELIFCYDNDSTGWTKSLNLINNPKNFGEILVTVTSPQDIDTDPHEAWKQGGDGVVYQMLSAAVVPLEYYINRGGFQLDSLTEKHRLLASLRDYLLKVSGIHLSIATTYLSELLNTTTESIKDFVSEIRIANSQLFNSEAERTLLACCMKVSASYSTAKAAGIVDNSFTSSKYKKLFISCQIASDKFGENYTPQAVLDEAMAKYVDYDLPEIVPLIMEDTYKYTEAAACEIVLDMYRRRVAAEQADRLIESSYDL
ncbi:hypothetical protein LCGC14_1914010, partial [marine sediment metagenome]